MRDIQDAFGGFLFFGAHLGKQQQQQQQRLLQSGGESRYAKQELRSTTSRYPVGSRNTYRAKIPL